MTKSQTVGRNSPCPCGSGKKLKKCCDAPHVLCHPHPRAADVVYKATEEVTSGWHPRDDVSAAMLHGGLPPASVFAYEQTGLVLFGSNREMHSQQQVAAWAEAVALFTSTFEKSES